MTTWCLMSSTTPQGVLKFSSLAIFPHTCQEPQLSWSTDHSWKIDTLELLPVQLTWGISLYLYLWKAQLFLQLPMKTLTLLEAFFP